MAVHTQQRGTKRTCQNEECGARFYDLMRSPIKCPICQSAFIPPPVREISLESPVKKPRSPFRPSPQPAVVAEAAEVVADDADEADTKIDAEESDSVLELEEDDGEVIVDPSVTESEKG
ncbi:MAG: FYDLN acid domain-containing protein [Hyphomicrobium sp.]